MSTDVLQRLHSDHLPQGQALCSLSFVFDTLEDGVDWLHSATPPHPERWGWHRR